MLRTLCRVALRGHRPSAAGLAPTCMAKGSGCPFSPTPAANAKKGENMRKNTGGVSKAFKALVSSGVL